MKRFVFMLCLMVISGTMSAQAADIISAKSSESQILWELIEGKDYNGQIRSATVDAEGKIALLATHSSLYEVRQGKIERISKDGPPGARLALAPGGAVYAWLTPHKEWHGLYSISLINIEGNHLSVLKLEKAPFGFCAFYMGHQGKLLVTSSPLDDHEGIHGRFLFTFWNLKGQAVNSLILEEGYKGAIDSSGESIVLMGPKKAMAFSHSGGLLWTMEGHFRMAALARRGHTALLNPAELDSINKVVVYKDGRSTTIKIATPVHVMSLSPDGSTAVIVGDRGRYFYLDPGAGKLDEGPALPAKGMLFTSNAKLIDNRTLSFGVLHGIGEGPNYDWPSGSIYTIDRSGTVLFQKDFPVSEAVSSIPAFGFASGSRFVVGYTLDRMILVDLGR